MFSGFSKSKIWASPEWPPYLPSSPPWVTLVVTTLRSKFAACLCSGDNAWHVFMRSMCRPRCRFCLLVCLPGAHMSLSLFEKKRLGKGLLSWSLVSPLPHSCQDACSTESVWGCHASAEKVFIIPLLFKTLGARGVQQLGVCTRAAPAELPIQIHPGVPREADPTLGVNAVAPLASSPTCPFSLGLPGIFQPIPTWVFFSPCTAVWYFLPLKFLQTVPRTKNALLFSSSKHWSWPSSDNLHTLQWSGISSSLTLFCSSLSLQFLY